MSLLVIMTNYLSLLEIEKSFCVFSYYGQKLKEAAEKLGVSVRTVQRLVKKWEQDGVVGFTQTGRADKGRH